MNIIEPLEILLYQHSTKHLKIQYSYSNYCCVDDHKTTQYSSSAACNGCCLRRGYGRDEATWEETQYNHAHVHTALVDPI